MIVVAGDALVDLLVRPDGAIIPAPGGGPYNSGRAIGRLGMACAFIGGLSDDRFGRMLEAGLLADGVAVHLAQRTGRPTTLALAELDADGTAAYRFYVEGTSAPAVLPGPLAGGLPADTRALLTGTLALVLEPMATTLEGLVAALPDGVLLMVDPNARPSVTPDPDAYRARVGRLLRRADIVKVSTDDLAFLRPGEPTAVAAGWVASLGPPVVLLTDGGGAVTVLAGGASHSVQVPAIAVIDTVGAGDTFAGAVLACLVHEGVTRTGLSDAAAVLRATRFGVRAAGIACQRPGADPPRLADLGGWPAPG